MLCRKYDCLGLSNCVGLVKAKRKPNNLISMSEEGSQLVSEPAVWQFSGNGVCVKAATIEEKLDAGKIQEAESTLCEKLSISSEVWKFTKAYLRFMSYFPTCRLIS